MQEVFLKQDKLDFRSLEAIKTLRTNVEFSGTNVKTVLFTSTTPGEGKSTVSFELARSFAQAGRKTLLLDLDLRKSVMKGRYKRGRVRYGISHYLIGKVEIDDVLCFTDIPNLFLVFAGPVPPNPSELLHGERFEEFMTKAKEIFDFIVIDTPPIGSVIDAAIVSKHCDGGIIVVKSGKISYRYAKKVKEQLEMAGCKILGCVLNQVKINGKGYYGKYYGKYYGDYYGEEKQ